ncbi:hypothetical protein J2128_000733 [Methanomicrobium sp. W14]|uniref:hypothetical protein n=1 Tax=Methanomicrobium sp. W14 TaxID=2817839 RepID=UPI001AE8D643|nr:hypothetical protein [Methanomicrobium sp. W14]MBP2132812.1 hypothetical protein [Methanomicrobium sp. W14]
MDRRWVMKLSLLLVGVTIVIYSLKYLVFHNMGDTLNYIFNSLGFLPLNVLLVTIVINDLLTMRAKREKLDKLNMVIGTFFTEVGNHLIKVLSESDSGSEKFNSLLLVKNEWNDGDFARVRNFLLSYNSSADISRIDIPKLNDFLSVKRDFLLRMLENPVLLEHESFTELLRAVFHMAEELKCRGEFDCLPVADYDHLSGDLRRVYESIVVEWLDYMRYLKRNYPYLFSLEMRMNPFSPEASPVIND